MRQLTVACDLDVLSTEVSSDPFSAFANFEIDEHESDKMLKNASAAAVSISTQPHDGADTSAKAGTFHTPSFNMFAYKQDNPGSSGSGIAPRRTLSVFLSLRESL